MRLHAEEAWTPQMQQVYGGLRPCHLPDYTPLQIEGLTSQVASLAQQAGPLGGLTSPAPETDGLVRENTTPSRRQRAEVNNGN